MNDKNLEKHLRNACAIEMQDLRESDEWEEADVDFDDNEVRIVFTNESAPGTSITFMYQPETEEEEDND